MTATSPVILATCHSPPVEPEDDSRLTHELEAMGCSVRSLPWMEIHPRDLRPGQPVVLRSTWDYHRNVERFQDWLSGLEGARAIVINSPALIKLTIDKSYLTQKRPFASAVPETLLIPSALDAVLEAARARGWTRFILKPPISASAEGTFLLYTEDSESIRNALSVQPPRTLIQEYLSEIRNGELSLIFFDGWYSHAVQKIPASGEFRVQSEFGSLTQPIRPPAPVIAAARQTLLALPEMPCYARVDGILHADRFILMELELIEPELFLAHSPGAAEVFAQSILRRIRDARARQR